MGDNITPYLPTGGYFHLYQELTKYGEACPRFHFFTALATLGSVVKRKIFFQRGSSDTFPTIFPNPWIILIAPQGKGHKSTSLRVGYRLMMKMPDIHKPKVLASKITPEALIKALAAPSIDMSKYPAQAALTPELIRPSATGVLYSSELSVMLGKEKYNTGFIGLMTELYDCADEWGSETVMRGDQRLYNVCLTFMGATTQDALVDFIPKEAFKTGFMSRIILVPMPQGWNKKVANPHPPDPGLIEAVMAELEEMSQIKGRFDWDKSAKNFFDTWYYKPVKHDPGSLMAAYLERKQDHMLKIAMLLQLSYTKDKMIITGETLEQAHDILTSIEEDSREVINFITTEPRMRPAQYVLDILRHETFVAEHELLKMVWRTLVHPREFQDILGLLMKAKLIDISTLGKEVGYVYTGKRGLEETVGGGFVHED